MVVENTEEHVREIAFRLCMEEETKRKTDPNETHERSIIIVGSKSVGKTTLIYRFLEKEETPKPTIAMDYSFGRKAGKSLVKNIVHVWEVGHLASSSLSAAMSGSRLTHSPHHTTLMLMIDISKPDVLWSTVEEMLPVIRSSIKMSYDAKTIEEMKQARLKRMVKNPDNVVDPFPMKICIIGGKYDEFKEFDLDKKQMIGKTLRVIALTLGATLHYHSAKDKTLIRRTKELMSHYGFGASPIEGKCMDYEKPLFVPFGTDSLSLIDLQLPRSRPSAILDTVKQIYISRFPQLSKTDDTVLEDPSNDPNFAEAVIDRLRVQKEEEISVLLHEMLEGRIPKIPIPDPS